MSTLFTPTPTTSTAPAATSTDLGNTLGGGNSNLGAATYYGAIALAIATLLGVTITTRIIYTRRARRNLIRDRMELTRRGEGSGLPTYHETLSPQSFSYLTHPLSSLRTAFSTPVPPTHPDYVEPSTTSRGVAVPRRAHLRDGGDAPPAYIGAPPKYEDDTDVNSVGVEGEQGIEMAERGEGNSVLGEAEEPPVEDVDTFVDAVTVDEGHDHPTGTTGNGTARN